MAAGVLLLCFSLPATAGIGVALILFSIGTGLYACWVTRRIPFTARVFSRALLPAAKFEDLNGPAYLMVGLGFLWISVWCLGVIGALNFYYPALTIIALVLSLMWTAEVMRNVTNLTRLPRVALRADHRGAPHPGPGAQPAGGGGRIHVLLRPLLPPRYGVRLSLRQQLGLRPYRGVWEGFRGSIAEHVGAVREAGMEELVDSDITSSVCFLTGVCSGAICTIFAASWTFATHKHYTATASLLAFFVGYLMTRIGMALPQACVACYYVCFAENPSPRLFDSTIPTASSLSAPAGRPW
uniref:Choline transporter-like protein n=1 Tax=Ananas comosus var. bracteatus TaxID=296719 RepID=A0A6V7PSG3_ANACO|nr:unnamed protein product [Ananas comosus var. bracteatus]